MDFVILHCNINDLSTAASALNALIREQKLTKHSLKKLFKDASKEGWGSLLNTIQTTLTIEHKISYPKIYVWLLYLTSQNYDLVLFHWMQNNASIDRNLLYQSKCFWCEYACICGHLDAAQYFYSLWPAGHELCIWNYKKTNVFIKTCTNNKQNTAKWLYEKFDLQSETDIVFDAYNECRVLAGAEVIIIWLRTLENPDELEDRYQEYKRQCAFPCVCSIL